METALTSFEITTAAFKGAIGANLCFFLFAFGIWLANRDELWRGLAFMAAGGAFTLGMFTLAP